jgi:hypothetical protein
MNSPKMFYSNDKADILKNLRADEQKPKKHITLERMETNVSVCVAPMF